MTNRRRAHHSQEARDRLASFTTEARSLLGVTQGELASPEWGGPSTTTLHFLESGNWEGRSDFARKTKWQYEQAVGWARGSVDVILGRPDGKPRLIVAERVGDQLVQVRVGSGAQHRDVWCAQQQMDVQLVHDAEQGLLYHFTEWQIAHLEKGYGLVRGTIRQNLTRQATELAVIPGAAPSGAATALAKRLTRDAEPFEELILREMEVNERAGRGNLPNWQSEEERLNWNALANARRPVHELVANAVWWRVNSASQNAPAAPREHHHLRNSALGNFPA